MTVKWLGLVSLIFVSALSINSAMALPIDWNGVFGMDTHMISNTCRTSDTITAAQKAPAGVKTGTQGLVNGDCGASFQTYIVKLNPTIIVNDGVTLKGELSSGYARGGFGGDEATANNDGTGNNAYNFTTAAQNSALNVNQLYMQLYADTAVVKIGRMSKHYGLGMVWDNGSDPWDRFFTLYDGIEATMNIGNFSIVPYYAKISSNNNNRDATQAAGARANGTMDVRELGLMAQYDNKNRDFIVSVLYAKRSSERRSTLYNTTTTTTNNAERGKTAVTIIEPYVSKRWNKFSVAAEATMQNGDYGHVYDTTSNSNISTTSYILESKYELNPKWDMGVNAGIVSGDKGGSDKFEATYLHPNYHIAELMFSYNYAAFNEGGKSIFDNSITNTRFLKLYGNYKSDKWTWKTGFVMAKARESAKAGSRAYHHEENYSFTSNYKQSDDMGYEVDFGFDYRWNPNVTISGYYGYWKVGEYYSYTNSTNSLSLSSVHGGGLRAMLEF